jgi:hypothetical protein
VKSFLDEDNFGFEILDQEATGIPMPETTDEGDAYLLWGDESEGLVPKLGRETVLEFWETFLWRRENYGDFDNDTILALLDFLEELLFYHNELKPEELAFGIKVGSDSLGAISQELSRGLSLPIETKLKLESSLADILYASEDLAFQKESLRIRLRLNQEFQSRLPLQLDDLLFSLLKTTDMQMDLDLVEDARTSLNQMSVLMGLETEFDYDYQTFVQNSLRRLDEGN